MPNVRNLQIVQILYEEALELSETGTPSIFSVCSLLENEEKILSTLERKICVFPDENEQLFPPEDSLLGETLRSSHNTLGSTMRGNREKINWEEIVREDDKIQEKFFAKQKVPAYRRMKEIRRGLPAWKMMNEILEIIDNNQVVIVSGETGCGKSTQVPQFLLDNWLLNRSQNAKQHSEIICTQPRRISAIGVAERVASERDERIGNSVGYQIRLESKMSHSTRLTFCTIGILLQRFSSDPCLKSITHVVVDEVHERSAER